MELLGSCDCGAVRFVVQSDAPYPYRVCYCRRCRKLDGGTGAAINILATGSSLEVHADAAPTRYCQRGSELTSCFCPLCGSALWVEHPAWGEWVYPFASAIDTPLPVPPEFIHIQLAGKPDWVPAHTGPRDRTFDANTEESILQWHQRLGLLGQ